MRRLVFRASAITIAASLFLAGAPAGPTATDRARAAEPLAGPDFGVQFHATWGDYTNAQRIEVLDKMAAAGVTWVRIDLGWASFEERCRDCLSQWYVDLVDFVVDAANARGIKVLGTLWRTPGWANGGAGVLAPPSDPADYGRFARWAARHFRGRVAAWQVWNEPNLDGFFTGTVGDYVRLLKAAYPELKAGDPDAKVVLGGPSYNDTPWLTKVYDRGAGGSFDVLSTHPYQSPADLPPEQPDSGGTNIWVLSHVGAVRDLMVKYGDAGKEIWFTEFGWSSHSNDAGTPNWNRGVSAEEQGEYLVRTIEYVRSHHPYVTKLFWYNERNRSEGSLQLDNYGLLNRDLSSKPAYETLARYLNDGELPAAPEEEPPTLRPRERISKRWINRRRTLRDRTRVEVNPALSDEAHRHAKRMARRGKVFPLSGLADTLSGEGWEVAGQNVGSRKLRGTVAKTVRAAHRSFMRHRGQRRNVLLPAHAEIGVGVARARGRVWVSVIFAG